jgi:NAD(P)H-flavin reductase
LTEVAYGGRAYECRESETVLEALLRHRLDVPYSCKKGVCLSCMLRVIEGPIPEESQAGIRDTLRAQGYFLPCLCPCDNDLTVAPADQAALFSRAVVSDVFPLAPDIKGVRLTPATELYYHAGQFINLRRADGLTRSYSLASVPGIDRQLELHVKRLAGGDMSNWIFDELQAGEVVELQGPNGSCFYLPGRADQNLLLIGTGTGLAPLIGIARDALHDGHRGDIRLYHGSRHAKGLYLGQRLRDLAARHANFRYIPCLSGADVPTDVRAGRVAGAAFSDLGGLADWRVFICGAPPMVEEAKKTAYLAGAAIADIHADPFELRDLRRKPRPATSSQLM